MDCICENLGDTTLHNLLICNLLDWTYERFSEAGNLVGGPGSRNFAPESLTIKINDYGDKENLQGQS